MTELDFIGRCPVHFFRIRHRFGGQLDTSSGALEIKWDTGDAMLIDTRSDWTLSTSRAGWTDPYGDCSQDELAILEDEVGVFIRFDVSSEDSLVRFIRQPVSDIEYKFNEVDERIGITFVFENGKMHAHMFGGELTVVSE